MKKNFKSLLLLTVFLLVLSGCGRSKEGAVPNFTADLDRQLIVYTTIYPLTDFTQKIGGGYVKVNQLIPPGVDCHHFEPSAKTLAELSRADLLIYNGANMEPWIEKVQEALSSEKITFVNASENISLLSFGDEGVTHGNQESHDHELDPHVWLNPKNAAEQAKTICQALTANYQAQKPYFEKNLNKFLAELNKLDQEYRKAFAGSRKREFVVAHNSFGYLAEEYGLTQIPLRGLTAQGEPSPTKLREIIALAKNHGLSYIFYESLTDPKASLLIAQELGGDILELNPLGNLTEKQIKEGEDYFSIMRTNLANLKIALNEE